MIRLIKVACLVGGMISASAASAAIYSIDSVLDYSANGFGSSMFHSQSCGMACGSTIADYGTLNAGGTWNSGTGAINFSFSDGDVASVSGNLGVDARTSALSFTGISGYLDITFAAGSSIFAGLTKTFTFRDVFHNNEANGHNGTQISLWGDLNNFMSNGYCASHSYQPYGYVTEQCAGTDLRLGMTEIPGVPLPAPALMLLSGLFGFGALRRARRA